MSNPDRIIRNARLAERTRRNNPWSEPACLEPRLTDAQILAAHYGDSETHEERIQRRLNSS